MTLATPHEGHAAHDPSFLRERVERYYRDRLARAWGGVHPMKGRKPNASDIRLRSNDYMCLAGHRRIVEAEIAVLRRSGHGEAVSRIWLHHERDELQMFEQRLAGLMGAEAAVLVNSGYCANVGLIQAFTSASTPVYIDLMAHMSLWEGIKSAGAVPRTFRHNDAWHLDRIAARHGPGLVVVDALYSTDGDLCPLHDLVEVAERHGCAIVVDETHSFGTHGPDGAGLVVEQGLSDRVHFRTIGLSKAAASRGGAIVCSGRNAEYFRYEALPAIFSTSVLAHEVAGYDAVLDVFASEPWRRRALHDNHAYLRAGLHGLGYNVASCKSQILALEAGEVRQTVKLRDALEKRGVFGSLFFAPAVSDKRCLIRFSVNCGLDREQLDRVIAVCGEIRAEVNLLNWRSTRRQDRIPSEPTSCSVAA